MHFVGIIKKCFDTVDARCKLEDYTYRYSGKFCDSSCHRSHNGYSHFPLLSLLPLLSVILHPVTAPWKGISVFSFHLSCRFVSAKPWGLYKHKFWASLYRILVRFTRCLLRLILISSSHLCRRLPSVLPCRFLNGLIL